MKSLKVSSVLLALLFVQCSSPKTSSSDAGKEISLEGTYWKLTELNGQPIPEPEQANKELHLMLKSQDSTITAFAGCNGVGGNYELMAGNRIRFSRMISTMMACPALDTENAFKKVLETVDNYAIAGDMLSLNKAKMAPMARFKAVRK
jgi:heat shock protein HslJ